MTSFRTKVIRLLLVIACAFAALFGAWYTSSFKSLSVTYKNAHGITIYKTAAINSGDGRKPTAKISASGQEVKLREGSYTIHYIGNDGYQSKYVEVDVTKKHQKFSIDPDYSEAKLKQILAGELPAIQAALNNTYKNSSLYDIRSGKLYERGDWFGGALVYKGAYSSNSDTLRFVMHKENGEWVVKTDPPNIVLSKYIYPDVPIAILRDVNSFQPPSPSLSNDNKDPGFQGSRPR